MKLGPFGTTVPVLGGYQTYEGDNGNRTVAGITGITLCGTSTCTGRHDAATILKSTFTLRLTKYQYSIKLQSVRL